MGWCWRTTGGVEGGIYCLRGGYEGLKNSVTVSLGWFVMIEKIFSYRMSFGKRWPANVPLVDMVSDRCR